MKFKLTALILALTVASWAQTATQSPSASENNAATQAKTDCACCAKMARAAEGKSCCHHDAAAKEEKTGSCCAGEAASSCCTGKDEKSCMKSDKGESAVATCADCCGKDHEKGCYASHKKSATTGKNCCSNKLVATNSFASVGR